MIKIAKILALSTLAAGSAQAQLKITEVQSSEMAGLHQDWWELTNFGGETVSLNDYKFDDSSASLASAVLLSANLAIKPGESIVFVETLTPQEFRTWWGTGGAFLNQCPQRTFNYATTVAVTVLFLFTFLKPDFCF